ncbi:MAG: GtrA family protein [Alphaproteobacteria bacterium]|nr:GtrA family protein [Alphaproteobacteria bacterium]
MNCARTSQIICYVTVGVVAAIAHYGALVVLVEYWRIAPVPASLVAFVVGGVASYALNRRYTFASDRPHTAAIPRFAVTAAGGFVVTGVLMYIFVDAMQIHYFPAQIATTVSIVGWTFAVNRNWTFGAAAARR